MFPLSSYRIRNTSGSKRFRGVLILALAPISREQNTVPVSFLGLSLLPSPTETLAMQATGELLINISTAFTSSPRLYRVFLKLDRNTENTFLFLLENTATKKNESNLLTLIIKMLILFASAINTSTARASSLFLSSYRNAI